MNIRKFVKKIYLGVIELLASIAVAFNLSWPKAYRIIGFKHLSAHKKLRLSSKIDFGRVKEEEQKIITYLEKYISFDPKLNQISEWIDANFRLSALFLGIPDKESIDKAQDIGRRVGEFIENIPIKYNIREESMAFIPRPLAEGSLGVYENLENYLKAMALGLMPAKKLFLLVDPKSTVNNPCYLDYWGEHITVVTDEKQIKSLIPQEQYLSTPMLGLFKQYGNKSLLMHIGLGMVREQWLKQNFPPLLNLSDEDKNRGWDALVSLGVPQGSWFVGLHIREPGWRDAGAKVENPRNANIETYYDAIKSVTDAGGWVVRLGDAISMTLLPQMEHVIDYAHSDLKSDWMDIFLSSQCRFLIGTGSGIYTVAMAFGVPCVMTNLMPANNIFAMTSRDIVLTKLCRSEKEKRYLTFKEVVSPPVGIAIHAYKDMGIETIDNTPEEIKGAVGEMMEKLDGTVSYTKEDEFLQNEFRSVVKECAELYGDKDIEVYARVGRDYLRKHADLLSGKELFQK